MTTITERERERKSKIEPSPKQEPMGRLNEDTSSGDIGAFPHLRDFYQFPVTMGQEIKVKCPHLDTDGNNGS